MAHECCSSEAQARPSAVTIPVTSDPKSEKAAIAALPTGELIRRCRVGVENFDRRIFLLDETQLDHAFKPSEGVGAWPIRVLLGHLADAELANAHRARRIVAEESPVFSVWDENAFVEQNLYGVGRGVSGDGVIGAFVAVVHTLRQWTSLWLTAQGPAAWTRSGMHPEKGQLSLRDIVVTNTWHLEHHAKYLNAKVQLMLGPAGAESEAGACCGGSSAKAGSCGCQESASKPAAAKARGCCGGH